MERALSEVVTERIEQMRKALGVTQEAVAEGSLMSRSNYVNKTTRTKNTQPFSVNQIEAVANYFRRVTRRPLPGWPFISEEDSEALDKVQELLKGRKRV